MANFSTNSQKIGSIILNVALILIIIYIVFSIGRSIYGNYNVNKTILRLKSEIAQLEEKKHLLENLIIYYQTMTFKELEARRQLGLKKPDEKMIILPENDGASVNDKKNTFDVKSEKQADQNDSTANYSKWWSFITDN